MDRPQLTSALDASAGGLQVDRGGRRRSHLACGKRADDRARLAHDLPGFYRRGPLRESMRRHVSRMREAIAGDPAIAS